MNDCLNICFEKGIDVTENKQRNDIRILESKEWAHRSLWKCRDDNGVMHPDEIEVVFRMHQKKLPNPENMGDGKRAGSCKQRKGHLRMEKLTKAINSSSHIRICAMQIKWIKDNRGNEKWQRQINRIFMLSQDKRHTKIITGNEKGPGL